MILNDIVRGKRDDLNSASIQARRELLKSYVDKVEIGKDSGKLWVSFPLEEAIHEATGLWQVPARGFVPKTPHVFTLTWA